MLLPGAAVLLLAGRRRLSALATFAAAAALLAWLRAAGMVGSVPAPLLVVSAIGGGALFVFARNRLWSTTLGGALLGLVAGSTWMPCVGDRLGVILNNAPSEPLAQLLPMTAYVLGVCAVLFAVGLVPRSFPRVELWMEHWAVVAGGIAVAGLIVVGLAGGFYNDVLSRFAQLSVR